jgi:3-oxoacyl-[acyl-carrier protein] reductase
MHLDVTDRAQAQQAAADVVTRWGRLDALVNNAGVTADRLLVQTSETDWDRVLAVNLKGAFLCSQAILRTMSTSDGQIINIAASPPRRQKSTSRPPGGQLD